MTARARLSESVAVRFNLDIYSRLQADAQAENISMSEVVRQIVEQHYQKQGAELGLPVIEEALRRVLVPHVDRLAGLSAHAGIAAGMSAWLSRRLLKELTEVDTGDVWVKVHALSKENLKRGAMAEGEGDAVR